MSAGEQNSLQNVHTSVHTQLSLWQMWLCFVTNMIFCHDQNSGKGQTQLLYEVDEHFLNTWSLDEPQALHNGSCIVLFSASKQTHCSLVIFDSEWMIIALHSMFFSVSTEVGTVLFGCYIWLVPHETAAVLKHVLCTQ